MRFLCFSDLHRNVDAAERLVRLSEQVDVVIGAGDFANRHAGLGDTLSVLQEISKPAVLVPGNGETYAELRDATQIWESANVLHGSGCEIEGVSFWGVGGGIPVTPFGSWSYDFDEEQAEDLLQACPSDGVLVVHSPPIDTVDNDGTQRVRGSQAIRDCVAEKQPKLVVCGHIHDDWEERAKIGESQILNAGPRGVIMDIKF